MRMEAKNSYFKRIGRISNFKNNSFSVAKRHQRLMCSLLQGKFVTFDDIECGPCKLIRNFDLTFCYNTPFIVGISVDGTVLENDVLKEEIFLLILNIDTRCSLHRLVKQCSTRHV